MSQGTAGHTERDSHDAIGVDPQASTRSRRLQPELAAHGDKNGKPEDAPNRGLRSLRRPFRRRGFSRRTNGPPTSDAGESVPCKFLSKNGHCRNGDRCRYSHSLLEQSSCATLTETSATVAVATTATTDKPPEKGAEDAAAPDDRTDKSVQRPPPKEPCRFFERHGFCRYGRGCRYAHKHRRDQQVKSTTRASGEATVNDSPKQNSYDLNPSASDQAPAEAVSEVREEQPSEEQLLKQLRDREIDQFRKRFRKSKKVPAGDKNDKYIFVFGPTDPDWPFDVKELTMMVAFPELYPKECFVMSVLDEEGVLPPTLLRDLNRAVKAWLDEKHSTAEQFGPGSLLLRPFLRWFDRNLETLFIESLRKVKKIQLAEAAGLEFVPFEQLPGATADGTVPSVDDTLSKGQDSGGDVGPAITTSNADNIQEKTHRDTSEEESLTDRLQDLTLGSIGVGGGLVGCSSQTPDSQTSDCNQHLNGATNVLNGFDASLNESALSSTRNDDRSDVKEKSKTNEIVERNHINLLEKPCHGVASSVKDVSCSEKPADAKPPHEAQKTGVDVHVNQKKGTEVKFRRLELGEGVATVECTKVAVRVQCGRCRCNADVVTPARRRNVVTCGRCSRTCSVTFRPNLMHQFNSVLGYFDLVDCFAVDLVLSGCVFALDCFGCNKRIVADGIHYGQRRSLWCQFCNAKMTVLMESVKFLQLQPSKAAENAGSAFSIKAPKMVKNVKDPAIQEGKPLPDGGICKHYKKSFRWLRFPCCGKAYPCDKCHEEQEGGGHEMKYATRMICGHCCKEQPFAAEKPCTGCANFMTKKPTAHWEGGRGCRDRIRMSRDDNKKFSGTGKTISRKAQEKLTGKK